MAQKKLNPYNYFSMLISILFILILLNNCTKNQSQNVTNTGSKEPEGNTSPQLLTPTYTPVSRTITGTPNNLLYMTNTATRPKSTSTPFPVLSTSESLQIISKMLNNNGNCRLPCWLGITPGITKWEEAKGKLQSFSEIRDQGPFERIIEGEKQVLFSHYITFKLPEESREGGAYISDQDGLVAMIRIGHITSKYGGFTLSHLLSEYGKPDMVFLTTNTRFPGGELPFRLALYYPDQNIFADFNLKGNQIGNDICVKPQDSTPLIWLWSNGSHFETDALFPEWALPENAEVPKLVPEVTDLTTTSFYETFIFENNSSLLCTSSNLWR